jgi:HTH-type transcriptional regulator / antitoxin HipB
MATRRSWDEVKAARKADPAFDTAAYEAELRRLDQREQFGVTLRQAREAAGMSQATLARMLGSTQPAVARLEAGMVDPKLSMLQRIAEVFGHAIEINAERVVVA